VYHAGTPSGAVSFPRLTQAAAATGLRTVTYSRALADYLAPQCESMAQVTGAQSADALSDLT